MAKRTNTKKAFWYDGYKIEYSAFSGAWFVCDWDYEDGLRNIGPSHSTKYDAMKWCDRNNLGEL